MSAMKLTKTWVNSRGLITEAFELIIKKKKRISLNFKEKFELFGLKLIMVMVLSFNAVIPQP